MVQIREISVIIIYSVIAFLSKEAPFFIFVVTLFKTLFFKKIDFDKKGNLAFVQDFKFNAIKTDVQNLGNTNFYNLDPLFLNPRRENYLLPSNSNAHEKGQDLSANIYFNSFINKDISGKNRIFPSTLGCYQK